MSELFPPGAHNYEAKADWKADDQWRAAKKKCHEVDNDIKGLWNKYEKCGERLKKMKHSEDDHVGTT
jgi:hypothetical protein